MTTKEFWNTYENEDILDIFDVIYDFFSEELPAEFIEDYDAIEVILETQGHHETAKNFDNVIKFAELLQTKHPLLYKEVFQYFNGFLIDYYYFYGNHKKVEESFSSFILYPISDFDYYLVAFRKLRFYGYTAILDRAIAENYQKVATSDELLENAGHDLAISKLYITLEEFYLSDNFEIKSFLTKLSTYDFDFKDKFLSTVEAGMCMQLSKEGIVNKFINDRESFIITFEMHFLKYMKERKVPFVISGGIWGNITLFLLKNNNKKECSPNTYFQVETDELEKYLSSLSGGRFVDNKPEMFATLWGSVYVYDFLKEIELINQPTFDSFIEQTKILKGKVIGQFTSQLWRYNFVHAWGKPDSISSTEFIEEEKIFKKSIFLEHQDFTSLQSEITEELANIGELSTHIIEGGKIKAKKHNASLLDNLFNIDSNRQEENETPKPVRTEKKIRRNEPCPCGSGKKYKKCCNN